MRAIDLPSRLADPHINSRQSITIMSRAVILIVTLTANAVDDNTDEVIT